MRERLTAIIKDVRELDRLDAEEGACPALRPLMARIARRPGRWRERMQPRRLVPDEQVEGFLPEAA